MFPQASVPPCPLRPPPLSECNSPGQLLACHSSSNTSTNKQQVPNNCLLNKNLRTKEWLGGRFESKSIPLHPLIKYQSQLSAGNYSAINACQGGFVTLVLSLSCVALFVTTWTVAPRLLCPGDSPGKNTGVGSLSLLQGTFPTQGSNLGLPHCKQILYHLNYQGRLCYSVKPENILGFLQSGGNVA